VTLYKIIRFHQDEEHPDHRKVIKRGLSLAEAQAHCQHPSTRGDDWFDGYDEDPGPRALDEGYEFPPYDGEPV
jgi:hypothetical protein